MAAQLRTGTCSWKYPSWHGLVYSAPKGIDYLAEYARKYDTVEVDQWFWSLFAGAEPKLPLRGEVDEYRRAVPDDFRFTVKAPNSLTLTHYPSKRKSDPLVPNPHFLSVELAHQFLACLEPIADVLGPVMFQFEYLNKQKLSGQAEFQERFADFVGQLPAGLVYGLETRNQNYLNEAFFRFLLEERLIPVLLQGYWMPAVSEVYAKWRSLIVPRQAVVIRLHGPDREGIEERTGSRWDRIVTPHDEELRAVAEMTQDLLGEGATVYVNANNHFEGSAPLTIARLVALLSGEGGEG